MFIDMLSAVWEFDLSDKIKWEFLRAVSMSVLLDGCTSWMKVKRLEKNYISGISNQPSRKDKQYTQGTDGEVRRNF